MWSKRAKVFIPMRPIATGAPITNHPAHVISIDIDISPNGDKYLEPSPEGIVVGSPHSSGSASTGLRRFWWGISALDSSLVREEPLSR